MKKILGAVIAVLLFATFAYAALPSAPDVAVFAKYPTDGTVDLYTGDMNLNIPLLTVPGRGGMDFPISLGYSAGIKVHQQPSWVGLGWNLGVGSITRSVNGIPDDYDVSVAENNIYYYNKFTSDVYYYHKETRTNWLSTVFETGKRVATMTAGANAAGAEFPGAKMFAEWVVQNEIMATFGGSPTLANPVRYIDYDTEQVSIPSEGAQYDFNGFLKAYNYQPPQQAGVGDAGFHDVNFPDTFILSSPLFNGQLVYGDSQPQTGEKLQLHLKRGGGNLKDRADDDTGGCNGIDEEKCRDAVFIQYEKDPISKILKKFTIKNVDGSEYVFEPTAKAAMSPTQNKPASAVKSPGANWVSFSQNTIVPDLGGVCYFNEDFNYNEMYFLKEYNTVWGLTEIRDSNLVNYDNGNWVRIYYNDNNGNWYDSHDSIPRPETGFQCIEGPDGTMSYGESWSKFKTLKAIETPTHVAMFYTEARQDGKDLDGRTQPRLRRIALYDKNTCSVVTCQENNQDALMTIYFDYTYDLKQGVPDNPTGGGQLTLKKVIQCGKGKASDCPNNQPAENKLPPYQFDYNEADQCIPPTNCENPNFHLKKFDVWGYFQANTNTLNHGDEYQSTPGHADAWSLRKVTWPSGSTTQWWYETDRFNKVGNWNGPFDGDYRGGGIRVSQVKTCPTPISTDCIKTRYLYTKEDLNFVELPRDSSGVANVLPGNYQWLQRSIIDAATYSVPTVGYSKVTVVPGYESGGSTPQQKAPYGYSVYEFTTAEDYPNGGDWKPPILFYSPAGAQNEKYGFSFQRSKNKLMILPAQVPIIVVGPKGHTLRFIFGSYWNYQHYEFCKRDVTIPDTTPDNCGINDGISGCRSFKFDWCEWWTPDSQQQAQQLYEYDCSNVGGTGGEWCKVMIDWTAYPSVAPNPSSAPMFFFRTDTVYYPDTNLDPYYITGICTDNDQNGVCDRTEQVVPSGNIDKSDFHGFNTKIRIYNINDQTNPEQQIINIYNFANPKGALDPSYHFPKAYWIPLDGTQTTLDGYTTTTSYVYNPVNGLPQEVYEQGNGETRITQIKWAAFDHLSGMADKHKWSQIYESNVYKDSTDEFNKKSYTKTEWAPGTQFTHGSDFAYFPRYIYSGTGRSTGEERLIKEFVDYDQNGGNLIAEKTYFDNNNYMLTKYYYGDNSNPCSQSPATFSHAYLTCIDQCKDPNCNVKLTTTYKYGDLGNKIQMGQIREIKDIDNGDATSYDYDNLWRLQKTIAPYDSSADPTKTYSYYYAMADGTWNSGEANYVQTIQKADNNMNTVQFYDGMGRLIQAAAKTGGMNNIRSTIYYNNPLGLQTEATKPYQSSTTLTYLEPNPPGGILKTRTEYYTDPLARVYKTYPFGEYPNGAYIQINYEGSSNYKWTSVKDEEGKWSASSVDKLGNAVDAVVASGTNDQSKTTFTTDILGNILTTKVDPLDGDPNSGDNSKVITTTNVYDTRSRLRITQNPDSGVDRSLVLDRQGKVLLAGRECAPGTNYANPETLSGGLGSINTYGCNILIAYEYDSLGRLLKVDYDFDGDYEIQYKYDSQSGTSCSGGTNLAGRLVEITDEAGKTCFSYDDRGRLQQKKNYVDETWYITSYTYDSANNMKTITYPSAHSVEYFYSKLGQLEGIEIDEQQVSFLYNPTGTIDQITFPNGITTTFDYTDRDWIRSQVVNGNNVDWQRSYFYDDVGNLLDEYNSVAQGPATQIGGYQYDILNRLTTVWDPNGYYGTNIFYTYDRVGNRESENIFNALRDYQYQAGTNKLISDSTYTYDYDSRGNVISKSAGSLVSYEFNSETLNGWTAEGGTLMLDSDSVEGQYSIKLTSTDINNDGRAYYNPPGTWDFSDKRYMTFWAKSGTGTAFTNGQVFIFDTNSPERWYRWDSITFPTEWSLVTLDLSNPSGSSGTPNLAAVTRWRFDVNTNGQIGKVDKIRIVRQGESGAGTTVDYVYNTANQLIEVNDGDYCENYIYNADGMRTIKESSFDTNLDWNEMETWQIKITNVKNILSAMGVDCDGISCLVTKIETDSRGNVYFNAGKNAGGAQGYLIKCDKNLSYCVDIANLSSPLATFAVDKFSIESSTPHIYASSGTNLIRLKCPSFWCTYNSVQETVDVGSNVRSIFVADDSIYVLHDTGVKKYSQFLQLLSESSSGLNSEISGKGPRAIAVSGNDVFIALVTGNKIIKTNTGLTGVTATYTDTTQPSHVAVDAEGYPYVVDKIEGGSRLYKLDKGLTAKLNVFEQYNNPQCSEMVDFSLAVGKGNIYITNVYCPYITSIPTGTQTVYIYDGINPIYEKTKIINATCLAETNNACGTVQPGSCVSQGSDSGYCFFGKIVMNCVKCGGCKCPDPETGFCYKCGSWGGCYKYVEPKPRQQTEQGI